MNQPLINLSLAEVPIDMVMSKVEAEVYKYAMEAAKFNQSAAAKLIGVSRGTLRTKLNEYYPGVYL